MELTKEDIDIIADSHPRIKEIINEMKDEIDELRENNRKLENHQNLNSSNSSIPPSKNSLNTRKKVYNQRKLTGKRKGGQPGHEGFTLELKEIPDKIIECKSQICSNCNAILPNDKQQIFDTRQVVDLEKKPLIVTEYQINACECSNCNTLNIGEAPDYVTQKIQYGPYLTALVVYLSTFQLLPYKRLTECLEDIFGCKISTGTIDSMLQRVSNNLESFIVTTKFLLISSLVVHFDETGTKVGKLKRWLHVACTPILTLYGIFSSRGKEAMDLFGILPFFHGIAVHDFWGSYPKYPCVHAFCNAHILRELTRVEDETGQQWAVNMRSLLVEMKETAEKYHDNGELVPIDLLNNYNLTYLQLVAEGFAANPPPILNEKKRGKQKQPHARNLLIRLNERNKEILRFLHEPSVPFDNNLAERDIRMPKLKMKISGPFRSEEGSYAFARNRSYISTLRKNGISVIDGLIDAAKGKPWIAQKIFIDNQNIRTSSEPILPLPE